MANQIHERIKGRISDLGLSYEAAAKLAKLDRGYFQKMFERPDSSPRADTLNKIANALQTTPEFLLTGKPDTFALTGKPPAVVSHETPALVPRQMMRQDIPVMGTAAGSHNGGAFKFEGGTIDYVRRPPALVDAKDIYALYVEGASMEPRFFPGDLIYINPHKPPKIGDDVILIAFDTELGIEKAILGVLRKRTEATVCLGKYNPEAEISFNRPDVAKVHKVMTTNELFGV